MLFATLGILDGRLETLRAARHQRSTREGGHTYLGVADFFYPKNKQLEGSGLCIYIYIDAIHMMYDIFFSE